MTRMKKIITATLALMAVLVFTACGRPDVSGKWYETHNTDETQLTLQIDEDKVTLNYAFIDYQSSFFTVTSEVKTGKIMEAKIVSNSEMEITEVYRVEDFSVANPFQGKEKILYSLSKDKETLTLSDKESDTDMDFLKKNPAPSIK